MKWFWICMAICNVSNSVTLLLCQTPHSAWVNFHAWMSLL